MRRGSADLLFPVVLLQQPVAGKVVTGESTSVDVQLRGKTRLVADTAVAVYATGVRKNKTDDPKLYGGFVGVCVLTPARKKIQLPTDRPA